jgi:hypothetical protein
MATEEERDRITVTESGRVAVISTYHGPTGDHGSRITVRRADGGGRRITVAWDYALGTQENHAEAIRRFLELMEWGGAWTVGATRTGAVATWAGWA